MGLARGGGGVHWGDCRAYYYYYFINDQMSKHAEGPSEPTVIDRARFTCRSRAGL
jgi:hypothetical protein